MVMKLKAEKRARKKSAGSSDRSELCCKRYSLKETLSLREAKIKQKKSFNVPPVRLGSYSVCGQYLPAGQS